MEDGAIECVMALKQSRWLVLLTPHITKNTPADSTLFREFHAISVNSTTAPDTERFFRNNFFPWKKICRKLRNRA